MTNELTLHRNWVESSETKLAITESSLVEVSTHEARIIEVDNDILDIIRDFIQILNMNFLEACEENVTDILSFEASPLTFEALDTPIAPSWASSAYRHLVIVSLAETALIIEPPSASDIVSPPPITKATLHVSQEDLPFENLHWLIWENTFLSLCILRNLYFLSLTFVMELFWLVCIESFIGLFFYLFKLEPFVLFDI